MNRLVTLVSLVALLGCGAAPESPEAPETQTAETAGPVLLISQKAAKSVAWYTLEGELLAETSVSDHPHEIVRSPDGSRLYVTDNGVMQIENAGEGGHKVSIIDMAAREKVGEIDLGEYHRPHGIDLCDDGRLLITSENPDQLLIADLDQSAVVQTWPTGGETPHIVKCSNDSAYAYVSNARSRTVAKIDLATGEHELVETDDRPEGSTLNRDGSKLFVAHRDSDKIVVIDTATWKSLGEIATGSEPVRVGLTGDETIAAYALYAGKAIAFADLETMQEVGQIPLDGPAVSLEMHEDGLRATTCAQAEGVCYVVDVPNQKILHTVHTTEGANPDPALLLE